MNGRSFYLYKLRSMKRIPGLEFQSTSSSDPRIMKIGSIIRKTKIDELLQLLNIVNGTMAFVGPRPNVPSDVKLYTSFERNLLSTLPGITDPASIIFSDESVILKTSVDPDSDYNKLIRPWKSYFALKYLEKRTFFNNFIIIMLTLYSSFDRQRTLLLLSRILGLAPSSTAYKVCTRTIDLNSAVTNPPSSYSDII